MSTHPSFYRSAQPCLRSGAGEETRQTCTEPASPDLQPSPPPPFITSGLVAAAPIGREIVEAILASHRDGLDRSEWILRKAKEFEAVMNGRAA